MFSGSKGDYDENDTHDEQGCYGVSKSLGEMCCNSTIIRTSIIGEEKKNKYSLLEWVLSHSNKTINGYSNHHWNGLTCLQLSHVILYMINNNIYWNGVRHVHSPTPVSKYELACMINSTYNLNNTVIPFTTDTYVNKTLSTIHKDCILDKLNIPEISEQISTQKLFSIHN